MKQIVQKCLFAAHAATYLVSFFLPVVWLFRLIVWYNGYWPLFPMTMPGFGYFTFPIVAGVWFVSFISSYGGDQDAYGLMKPYERVIWIGMPALVYLHLLVFVPLWTYSALMR